MVTVVILAAGQGRRMRSALPKVLHPLAGRPMLLHVAEIAKRLRPGRVIVVVGHQAEQVRQALPPAAQPSIHVIRQPRPLGTGHAVLQASRAFPRAAGTVLILSGDVPLVTEATLRRLLKEHQGLNSTLTILTAQMADPTGYGRIIRGLNHRLLDVVEQTDAAAGHQTHRGNPIEINAGIYAVESRFLTAALRRLRRHRSGEYHLPQIVRMAVEQDVTVRTVTTDDADEALGVNTRVDLTKATQVLRRRIVMEWMRNGVTILSPETTAIDDGVRIGQDTTLLPFTCLEGATRIGRDCRIGPHTRLTNCRLGNGVMIRDYSVLTESVVHDRATIGPFAHLRPGTVIHREAKIGNFVEVKQSVVGAGSKANHLSYLGDARIGRGVNIGAGTITCNYDGIRKHATVIEDGVFVGSDVQFIAPVRIGKGAVVGAGSTISKNVPPQALAVSRPPQVVRPGWAKRRLRHQPAAGEAP